MSNDIVVGLRIDGNSRGGVAATNAVEDSVDKLNRTTRNYIDSQGRLRNAQGQYVKQVKSTTSALHGQNGALRSNNNAASLLTGSFVKLGLAGAAAYLAISAGRKLVSVTREFQKLEASLVTATGSYKDAELVFGSIQSIASTTPYAVSEITTAFIKLTNLGLTPSKDALLSYMNTASAMGKSLDQFIEAVADASVGEFERLKEFGIKASSQGENVAFTFRGTTTTVKKSGKEIEGYLQSLGNVEFAGAMERQAATLDGAISNIGDSIDNLMYTISETGIGDTISSILRIASSGFDSINDSISSGSVMAKFDAYMNVWEDVANAVSGAFSFVWGVIEPFVDMIGNALGQLIDFVGDAFLFLPQNLKVVMTLAVNSVMDLVRAVKKEVLELRIAFNEFTGDDVEAAALKAQLKQLELIDKKQDEISDSKLQAVINQRVMAEQNFKAEIDNADKLGEKYKRVQAERANLDLGKYGVAANDEGDSENTKSKAFNGYTGKDSQLESVRTSLLTQQEMLAESLLAKQSLLAQFYADSKISEDEYLNLSTRANQEYLQKTSQMQTANNSLILSSSAQIFDGLAGLAETFSGKQSKTYQRLFAISKVFAIAQGVMALSQNIAEASKIGYPQNIPMIAAATAQGTSIISNLQAVNMKGQAHGGLDKNVSEGTWWLRNDEMVLNPNQAQDFKNVVDAANDGTFAPQKRGAINNLNFNLNQTNNFYGSVSDSASQQEFATQLQQQIKGWLADEFSNNGQLMQMIKAA